MHLLHDGLSLYTFARKKLCYERFGYPWPEGHPFEGIPSTGGLVGGMQMA